MKKPVKSIIENVEEFHFGLSDYFNTIIVKAKNKRAEMLLDYLSRREELTAEYLNSYLHESDSKVLETWINIVPWLPSDIFASCVSDLDIIAPLTLDDILDIAIHYDNCLIDFFTILERETEFTGVKTFFGKLLNKAKKEEKNLARDVLWLHDM